MSPRYFTHGDERRLLDIAEKFPETEGADGTTTAPAAFTRALNDLRDDVEPMLTQIDRLRADSTITEAEAKKLLSILLLKLNEVHRHIKDDIKRKQSHVKLGINVKASPGDPPPSRKGRPAP